VFYFHLPLNTITQYYFQSAENHSLLDVAFALGNKLSQDNPSITVFSPSISNCASVKVPSTDLDHVEILLSFLEMLILLYSRQIPTDHQQIQVS
jgi:hypothetical protein